MLNQTSWVSQGFNNVALCQFTFRSITGGQFIAKGTYNQQRIIQHKPLDEDGGWHATYLLMTP